MANLQKFLEDKKIHLEAQDLAENIVKDYADKLILQSKTFAILDGANEVQSNHVERAKTQVAFSIQQKARYKEIALSAGYIFIGLGLGGIIGEYSNLKRVEWILFYCSLIVVGLVAVSFVYSTSK